MNYCYVKNNIVKMIIPEFDSSFPNVPITKRYTSDVISKLIPDETGTAKLDYIYNPETKTFSKAPTVDLPVVDSENETVIEEQSITTDDIMLAIAELAEKQEEDKLELELAIAELAELTV